ncbi:MAG: TonB-dependent receptor [Tannerellaceae bacterium]|nr:TonB-dependent receptor [Tannerellaceae bacterium]
MKTHFKSIKIAGWSILLMLLITIPAFSQQVKITGKVTEPNGDPLPGASVLIKGTQIGIISGLDGEFSLESPNETNVVLVSMIGFAPQEITVNGSRFLEIKLEEKFTEIEDVVVIGYGTAAKKDLTGAVGIVKGEELNKMSVTSVSGVLQGKAAGVTVSSSSGTPGAPGVVRIRGIGSVTGSSSPLYVVDGLPQNDIDYLNPNDIESVVVHKDASVAAIYGSRGSNGIIIVTTKSGAKNTRMSVSYDGYLGVQAPWKRPHMLSASEFIDYKNMAADNANAPRLTEFSTQENIDAVLNFVAKNSGAKGTDWWNEIVNNQAFVQNHSISVNGGSETVGMLSSLSYLGQDGIVKGSEYERISWRNNINANVSKRVTLASNFGLIYEKRRVIDENNPYTGTIFSAMAADPITPVFRNNLQDLPLFMNNIYNGYEPDNLYSQYSGLLYSNKRNPVGQIERMRQSKYETLSVKGGLDLGIRIFDFLKFNSRAGIDLVRANTDGFQPRYTLNSYDYSIENKVINEAYQSNYFVTENTLTYDQQFDKLKIGALVGTSAESTSVSSFMASIEGIVTNDPDMRIMNAGTINPAVSGYPYSNTMASFFGRVTVDYDNKYLLAANLRRDGSSKFAKEHRWGTFPSVSAAWRFSAENFMAYTHHWLEDAKLRVSYGHIGNQNIGGGAYMSTYGSTIYDWYMFGDEYTGSLGGGRLFIGNPVLKWETSKQFDLGLDLNLLNGKIEFTADYFSKKIDNMLMTEPQPTTLGFPNFPYANVGSMVNKGWEFAVTYNKNQGDFRFNVSGNISAYRNKVTSLGNGDAIYGTAYLDNVLTKTEVGQPIGYFYGYVTNGIFQNAQQVEGSPQREVSTPGDIRFKDLNGDDFIDAEDRTRIGNPWPDFVYGLTFNASWKNFDFSMFIQGSQGNDVMNIMLYDLESGTGYLNASKGFLERAWNGEGSTDRYHKISQNQGLNNNVSDYFVEDGSYMRIKNIQLGYNFANRFLKTKGISLLRFYVSAQNLLTLTKYSGLDPEIGSTNATLMGIDQGFYPQARIFSAGLNIKF